MSLNTDTVIPDIKTLNLPLSFMTDKVDFSHGIVASLYFGKLDKVLVQVLLVKEFNQRSGTVPKLSEKAQIFGANRNDPVSNRFGWFGMGSDQSISRSAATSCTDQLSRHLERTTLDTFLSQKRC